MAFFLCTGCKVCRERQEAGSDDAQDVLATSDLNREAPFFQFGLQRWALVPLDFNIVALKCSTYAALLLQRFGQFTHVPFR